MAGSARKLAVVTGAASGIGLDLARMCAENKYDLIVAADEPAVFEAAEGLARSGITVCPVQCDLSTPEGVDALRNAIAASGRSADILIANAARELVAWGAGDRIIDQGDYIDGTIHLIDRVSRSMRGRGHGRILITYSGTGLMPEHSGATHDINMGLLNSFFTALSRELKHTGVTVTCLMSGAKPLSLVGAGTGSGYDTIMTGGAALLSRLGAAERHVGERRC